MRAAVAWLIKHKTIFWALFMRDLSSRFGRHSVGFFWLILEPVIFATGVSTMWSALRGPYEDGIRIVPFILSGYLPMILMRHMINHSVGAVKNNSSLLYYRSVTPLHLIIAQSCIEFIGVTLAAVLIVLVYHWVGLMPLPQRFSDMGYVYAGWLLLAWLSMALGLVMASLAEIIEGVERVVHIATYLTVPISGAFLMAQSMPPKYLSVSMSLPFIHEFELLRRGLFGASIGAMYDAPYAISWCVGLTVIGLALSKFVRDKVDVQ